MFATTENKTSVTVNRQHQNSGPAFFRKAGEETFFGNGAQPAFFNAGIQAKLSVSSPDDPQEKEADAMADRVMRMTEPAAVPAKEETPLQRKEEEEEDVQASAEMPLISRKCEHCEEEEEKVQAKHFTVQRSTENAAETNSDAPAEDGGENYEIHPKHIGLHRSDVIQLSGRGPPAGIMQGSFEQNLTSTKGAGNALPGETRNFMETRFNADFSGVRIHTGSYAEQMSSSIHAQAFTHGNDIYFNSGKYNPQSESGGTLLAHELTHTLQQGASRNVAAPKINRSPNHKIQRSAAGVPSQLTNAVEKAKTVEGKIDANKPQADGNRTGWEHLVEIFKTTFGEDKIISGSGGTTIQGTVAEQDIKKKREFTGRIVDKTTITDRNKVPGTTTGKRDAMPSWCGIFVFWALNKSGVPMPKWKLGERMIPLESARTPGTMPLPGDIAYRNAYSHFAIVESVSGNTVKTVNGNTAGEDNLGGQVQTIDHPISEWTAFFNPLLVMQGSLGEGEVTGDAEPSSIEELRREQPIQAKEEEEQRGEQMQAKTELSTWSVDARGTLHTPDASGAECKACEVQAKEEAEDKEEEKAEAVAAKLLQKKRDDGYDTTAAVAENTVGQNKHNAVHAAAAFSNSSLTNTGDVSVQTMGMERDRGPPVQACSSACIQRSPLDVALASTSLGELLDCVYITDLDRTSVCLLRKASAMAMRIPGYKALRVVLARDPISGVSVARNGRNLLEAAFDIMPGGTLLQQKLEETGRLDAAAAWIDGKINGLDALVRGLFTAFDQFWNRLGITDFRSPMGVMRNGLNIVFGFIGDLVDFAMDAAKELLEMVKAFLLDKIVEFIKEHTNAYPLLQVILGEDPVTKQRVDRNGTNILNAILELGGEEGIQQRTQMMETGTFQKVAAYIDEGIAVFGDLYDTIITGFSAIWDVVTIQSLMQPLATFRRIYNIFARPVARVLSFMAQVAREILKLIKEALMQRLSAWARTVRGYTLVTVIIGSDPFTGEAVPFTMENVIKGFFGLMEGGEEQYNQLKESGAIDRTVGKVTAAIKRLNMTPAAIIQLFIGLWNSFSIYDLMDPVAAFRRILDQFGQPILRLIAFVIEIVKIVIEAILMVMNFPIDIIRNIITRAMAAFQSIRRDPVGFLINLLRAIKQGFIQFFDNILQHLIQGLVGWLMSELREAGVPQLTDLSLRGVIAWVMEILNITMEKIWEKLAAHPRIGPQRVARIRSMINTLEGIWTFIRDVQERGMAAIWDKIQEQLSNLWTMIIDAVKNWIMERIITQVVTKLLSMLDPTGIMAVVNSVIAIYKAIQSFIKYLREMLEVVNSFVMGVADIAAGNIATAANYLERTMSRTMPIVIGFLANQVGLGGIGRRVGEMIERARELVDRALTWLVNKAVDTGMALLDRAMALGARARDAVLGWLGFRRQFNTNTGVQHTMYISNTSANPALIIESTPMNVAEFFNEKANEIRNSTMAENEKNRKLRSIENGRNFLRDVQNLMNSSKRENRENPVIPQLVGNIISIVQEIDPGAGNAVVPAPEILPGFNNAKARNFSARYIYNGGGRTAANHLPGTEPSDANLQDEWQVLRDMQLSSRWVRFHILNHNVGGIATDSNLIPTPSYYNNEYRMELETRLKGYYDQGLPIWLRANVTYRDQYNGYFADNFTANAGAMKMQNNQWVEDPEKRLQFSKSVDLPQSDNYNINLIIRSRDDQALLRRLTTVSQHMINTLRRNVPSGGYSNVRQMERVLVNSVVPGAMDFTPEHLARFTITDNQRQRVNEFRRGVSSVNWIF